ncbi:MAG: Serine hydroxymethyltransferase [Parcubacteria group bacterium GW2011_GWA2_47_8]|nr:MAG: Serine hydroxymethyltransferase [Parcubacteria group bacterium GW2011_GWA2_47_8]
MIKQQWQQTDPELYQFYTQELKRQQEGLELIPSENYVSEAVLEAMGSILTNKYSEGYAGKRYYGGNEFIDSIERIVEDRAKKLFGVPYVNVQPYSGSPANLAVYFATCKPGDTIMGLDLSHGGHLTHGSKASVTGQIYNSVPYHVIANGSQHGYIDFDELATLARKHKPALIWAGITAYSRTVEFAKFAAIADEVGAYLAADISHIAGLVVGGAHESPVPHVHIVTTTTHKTLRGPRGAMIMVTERGLVKDPELSAKIAKQVFPGSQGGPHDQTTAAIGIALLEASKPAFKQYAKQVVKNAQALASSLMKQGVRIVTGGTDNHMMLIDLSDNPGCGIFVQEALDMAGMTLNKNTIPGEPMSPFFPSGARLGTPAITSRGMKEGEMTQIGEWIATVLKTVSTYKLSSDTAARQEYLKTFRADMKKNATIKTVREQVRTLCKQFPLYADIEQT